MTTYDVFVSKDPANGYTARALAFPDITASAATEDGALDQVRVALSALQLHGRVVQVAVPGQNGTDENPWLRFAGTAKDDPSWDEYQAIITSNRKELDERFGL